MFRAYAGWALLLVGVPFVVTVLISILGDMRKSDRLQKASMNALVISFATTPFSIVWVAVGAFLGVNIDWASLSLSVEPIATVLVIGLFLVGLPLLGIMAEGSLAVETNAIMEGYLELTGRKDVFFSAILHVMFDHDSYFAVEPLLWGKLGPNGVRGTPILQGMSKFGVP